MAKENSRFGCTGCGANGWNYSQFVEVRFARGKARYRTWLKKKSVVHSDWASRSLKREFFELLIMVEVLIVKRCLGRTESAR